MPRKWRTNALTAMGFVLMLYWFFYHNDPDPTSPLNYQHHAPTFVGDGKKHWRKLQDRFSVTSYIPLPTGKARHIPSAQAKKPREDSATKAERLRRRDFVKETFLHSWEGYKAYAWLRDEVTPHTASYQDTFGGWAATLVDSLDTLWLMGLKEEFEEAVAAALTIDFTTSDTHTINVFETTIRYMGGFLGAYEVSGKKHPELLDKAVEVGELMMSAFDTPNRMPITRWNWARYADGLAQKAPTDSLLSEPCSLSLEFTRLSQLTGDPKYYDAIQRISNVLSDSQNFTLLPGMWPVTIDPSTPDFTGDTLFTLGGMSDSTYEYLPKQYLILNGLLEQPRELYETFIETAKEYLFFRVPNPQNEKILLSGDIRMTGLRNAPDEPHEPVLVARMQHLTCFVGGMVALASKIFSRPQDLEIAEQLTRGCIWAYNSSTNGVAPEIFNVMTCASESDCLWDEQKWHSAVNATYSEDISAPPLTTDEVIIEMIQTSHLPPGFLSVPDTRYILRPEALESCFLLYRITGDKFYADAAWEMFQAIDAVGRTDIAAAATRDVMAPKVKQTDSMESFWLGETVKYAWLCFEDWGEWGLDEWVWNTEAHLLRRGT